MSDLTLFEVMALLQGLFYFATGVWPLVSMRTFLMVTGPKTDLWLVKTVGTLIAVIGIALIAASLVWSVSAPIMLLATGAAASLAAIDMNYVLKGVIAKIYLLDAVVEIAIVIAWVSICIFA